VGWDDGGEAREKELRERARTWAFVSLFLSGAVVLWLVYAFWLR
jgi:hypothetical protein